MSRYGVTYLGCNPMLGTLIGEISYVRLTALHVTRKGRETCRFGWHRQVCGWHHFYFNPGIIRECGPWSHAHFGISTAKAQSIKFWKRYFKLNKTSSLAELSCRRNCLDSMSPLLNIYHLTGAWEFIISHVNTVLKVRPIFVTGNAKSNNERERDLD